MISSFKYPLVENPYEPDDIKSGISILKSSFITMGKKLKNLKKNLIIVEHYNLIKKFNL